VRSFDLGGSSATGRRWAVRCSCGVVATTSKWTEAMDFLMHHVRTARVDTREEQDTRGVA
jgi:hypothetical protein